MNDLRRASRIHAVPMAVLPSVGFPVLTLLAQRLLIAVRRHESKTVYDECVHRLFAAYWAQERDVSDATVLADSLRDSVTLKRGVDEYLELAKTVDVKRELQTCTEQVVGEYGAFGLPWIVVSKGSSSTSTGVALAPGGDASASATTTASKDTTTTACFFGSDRFEAIAHFIDHPTVRYESALAQPVVTPTDPETDRSRSKL